MLIPEKRIRAIDVNRHDPTAVTPLQVRPALFKPGVILREEELILCKTDKGDKAWSLAEMDKVYPDEVEVIYYTTHGERQGRLSQSRFRKTWFIRTGTNAGKDALNPPFPKNPLLRLWTGKLPTNEFDDLILATGIKLEPNGYLTEESRKIASNVKISDEAINTIEDEEGLQAPLQYSNAMFAYAELPLCNCRRCRKIWTKTVRKESGSPLATTNLHPS